MDPLVQTSLAEGEEAISKLIEHAGRVDALIASTFPARSLGEVAAEFAKAADPKALNGTVAKLGAAVREEAAIAAATFRAAEMWLRLKAPAVSDGNNFGVDVQNYVIGEVQALRGIVEAFTVGARDYHWSRASGVSKLCGDEKATTSESSSKEVEDGKASTKSSTSSEKVTCSVAAAADYKEYLVAVDTRQYHATYTQLVDIKNAYLKAHVLFTKNMKKLTDPRGEGEDGRSLNAMSMF